MSRSDDAVQPGLIGVVLCGGESRRMGRDKGLILRDGTPWMVHMGMMLEACGLPVVYSVRADQEKAYSAVKPEAVFVRDVIEIGGPLNGLFSVHHRYPDHDLMVVACDMQDMDMATMEELIGEYRKGGAEFYVYYEGELAQPFCAIYTATGLARVHGEIGGERRVRAVIAKGVVKRLRISRPEAFRNFNSM